MQMGVIEMRTHEGAIYSSLKVLVTAVFLAALAGCGSDRGDTPLVQGSNGVASISGNAVVGETRSASVSDSDGVETGTETYQWYSDGDAISGATASTYTLTQNEGGETDGDDEEEGDE